MAKSSISNAIGFYLGYPFLWLAGWLPLWMLYGCVRFVFPHCSHHRLPANGHHRQSAKSLSGKSKKEIQKIRLRFYRHFCDLFVETLVLQHISASKIQKRVKLVNLEVLQSLLKEGHDVVAVLGHYGNWEWIPVTSLSLDAVGLSVYRPLKNEYFDRFMLQLTGRFWIPKHPLKCYSTGNNQIQTQPTTICVWGSSPTKVLPNTNYTTGPPSLNQNTPIILGPEKMAKLAKAKIVYWKMEKTKRGHYQITFIPYEGDVATAPEFAITEWQVRLLEQQIIEQPEYWLWSHKRWKYQHLYKKNQS
jgi:Kdo2-lipid IVA lauroyltransferase/acyltransferase